MYLMYELLWYLFVAIMEGIVTFKKSIVKYIQVATGLRPDVIWLS